MKRGTSRLLVLLWILASPVVMLADDEFDGAVEILYRNVSVDGSSQKYDEDFDGLDSGLRLGSLNANWLTTDAAWMDFASLDVSGLGGDPYERMAARLGRKDIYDLSLRYTKQDYVYNLFELVPDLDGSTWDSERRRTHIDLRVHALQSADLVFSFDEGRRTGSSLFMKDIERQIFRLDTPLDQTVKRYTVGADFELRDVNIMLRQTLRRYDNQFDNHTDNDLGLEAGLLTRLDSYEWLQNDSGGSDWTTLRISGSPGERVDFAVGLFGTFFGEEEIESDVLLNAEGTSFEGVCSVSGTPCESDADCALPGDVCVPNAFSITDGTNRTRVDGDTIMLDAELSVEIAGPLDLHLQHRSLDRELQGSSVEDLDGDGVVTTIDTVHDYAIDTSTALLEYRPIRQLGLRAGYRLIDRELTRTGFLGVRNIDYESKDDDTLIFGLTARPASWLHVNADYEDGEITQPFNAVAPQERDRTSVRATVTPKPGMKLDLSYVDFDRRNTAPDIRAPTSRWDTSIEGETWSASFWHEASDNIDYLLRYAVQEIDSAVGVTFDQAGFGAVETGDSIFDNDNRQFSGQVNFKCSAAWTGFVRWWMAESDGDNILRGDGVASPPLAPGVRNLQPIDQEFRNAEAGLTYTFSSGIFVGASLRDFDYEDVNQLLDYDGQLFTVRAGTTF